MKLDWRKLEIDEPCKFASISPPPYFELFAIDYEKWVAKYASNTAVPEAEALELARVSDADLASELLEHAIPAGFNGEKAVFLYYEEDIYFDSDPCKVNDPEEQMDLYDRAERVVHYHAAFVVVEDEETANMLQEKVHEHGANVAVLAGWEGLYKHIKGLMEFFSI